MTPLVDAAIASASAGIDCLVNNAGIGAVGARRPARSGPENFDRVLDVNLRGTVFLTQAVAKAMLAQRRSGHPRSIITITSVSAELASPERADYCISKAGACHVDARTWRCGWPPTASACSRCAPASSAPT